MIGANLFFSLFLIDAKVKCCNIFFTTKKDIVQILCLLIKAMCYVWSRTYL